MDRRRFLKSLVAASALANSSAPSGKSLAMESARDNHRVRPGDPDWPSAASWTQLDQKLDGRLLKLESPFKSCATMQEPALCRQVMEQIQNPYYIGDHPALTQTSGWVDAWTSQPSTYAVAAENTADVAAAVNFARAHRLRLVVKGGGHSYLGTSSAPDSLLVWTRAMNTITLHDVFTPEGCSDAAAQPAVTIGAGALWSDAYSSVTTRGGRYVQGGGCTTVGVAGLVQSGGFGNFSKNFGTAAANLLEAEIVTADGVARIANKCVNPDLFWGIKGGGGGSLGIVTRLTLRTHPLPEYFGAVFGSVRASSDTAYRALIGKAIEFYREHLFNPHWGETIAFRGDNILNISMVFQGLNRKQVESIWAPLREWIGAQEEYSFDDPINILEIPAQHFWDAEYFREHLPGILVTDERPGASTDHVVWAGDREQAGWYIHGYQSAWIPARLLGADARPRLADALFAASRHWDVQLHFNKGLAGAPDDAIGATRNTATNPKVLDAFALAIIAGGGPPAYAGMPGSVDNKSKALTAAASIGRAMAELQKVAPNTSAYVSESDYFQTDWQTAYWGSNYPRLATVKRKYDPHGLFFVHHGVGSEYWSGDGFTRLQTE